MAYKTWYPPGWVTSTSLSCPGNSYPLMGSIACLTYQKGGMVSFINDTMFDFLSFQIFNYLKIKSITELSTGKPNDLALPQLCKLILNPWKKINKLKFNWLNRERKWDDKHQKVKVIKKLSLPSVLVWEAFWPVNVTFRYILMLLVFSTF